MAIRTHSIRDAGAPFMVDPFTRKVTVPNAERVIGVVGDHCSEQVTFRIPKVIDGHNMLTCTRKYVAWRNVDGEPGTDELKVTEEVEDYALYTWTVRDKAAAAQGFVEFSLHFECDDPKTGEQIYSWGTHTCSACEILDSVNVIMGAYKAIYIDGETLVFADYTPVHEETLELRTGIVPKDTLEITEAGKHDVGRYAYADVKGVYDTPVITIPVEPDGSKGYIRAEANGLTAEIEVDPPSIEVADQTITSYSLGLKSTRKVHTSDVFKMKSIRISSSVGGLVKYQKTREGGVMTTEIVNLLVTPDVSVQVVAGSLMWASNVLNKPATVTFSGTSATQLGTCVKDSIESAIVVVPTTGDPGETIEMILS